MGCNTKYRYQVDEIARQELVIHCYEDFFPGFLTRRFTGFNEIERDQYLLKTMAEQTLKRGHTHFVRLPFDGNIKQICRYYQAHEAPIDAYDAREVLNSLSN